jgi:chemotaxis signal transduction protein
MSFDPVAYQHELDEKIARAKETPQNASAISVVAGQSVYNIDPQTVDFVDQVPSITPMPRTDNFVMGACHARGRMLKVLDLAAALGEARAHLGKLIAFKGRDIAIYAPLATEQDKQKYQQLDFRAAALGDKARLFLSLT